MARERPGYREELRMLQEFFPDKRILKKADIMRYTGRGRKWTDSHGFKGGTSMTLEQVATIMAAMR